MITDSGGFQVFSLAHGTVADEIKGRRGALREPGPCSRSARTAFGSARMWTGPSDSSARRSRWRSRPRSAPTSPWPSTSARPYHADRDYTARSAERTHRWLDRCLAWHERSGPAAPGRVRDRPGRRLRGPSPTRRRAGLGSRRRRPGDRRHPGPRQGGDAGRGGDDGAAARPRGAAPPARDRRARRPGARGSRVGIDLFDCAVPTRLARHGMALAPLPDARYRFDVRRARFARRSSAAGGGLPVRHLHRAHPRLRPLPVAGGGDDRRPAARRSTTSPTWSGLVRGAREAIHAGRVRRATGSAILGGAPPWARAHCVWEWMKSLIELIWSGIVCLIRWPCSGRRWWSTGRSRRPPRRGSRSHQDRRSRLRTRLRERAARRCAGRAGRRDGAAAPDARGRRRGAGAGSAGRCRVAGRRRSGHHPVASVAAAPSGGGGSVAGARPSRSATASWRAVE